MKTQDKNGNVQASQQSSQEQKTDPVRTQVPGKDQKPANEEKKDGRVWKG
ncbi:hypothetical protein [Pseudomonas aeruginosa]|nr:hypothetical protein [Pseudomonas aeruginosa]